MSLKKCFIYPQYPSWVVILRALVLWCASQLFLLKGEKNLDSLAFIIMGKKYGSSVCVWWVYFYSWKTEHVLLLLELSQSQMGYCAYLIS